MPAGGGDLTAGLRRARRDFVRAHHPDRGGDPAQFLAGLRRLDEQLADAAWPAGTSSRGGPVTVVRPPTGLLGRVRAALARRAARRARRARLR